MDFGVGVGAVCAVSHGGALGFCRQIRVLSGPKMIAATMCSMYTAPRMMPSGGERRRRPDAEMLRT